MFKIGDEVSFGLHGRCIVSGIEEKVLNEESIAFYQIKVAKNPAFASRSTKNSLSGETVILIPIQNAERNGLRRLMSPEGANSVFTNIVDLEFGLELSGPWVSRQKLLEETIRRDGYVGLTKAVAHVHSLMSLDAVPPTEVAHFFEIILKALSREISYALTLSLKESEERILKALKQRMALTS